MERGRYAIVVYPENRRLGPGGPVVRRRLAWSGWLLGCLGLLALLGCASYGAAVTAALLLNGPERSGPAVVRRLPRRIITLPAATPSPSPVPTLSSPPTAPPAVIYLMPSTPTALTLPPTPTAVPTPLWPVRGEISQDFGCSSYYTGLPGPDCPAAAPWFHDGVDIAAEAGRPVRAILGGEVIFAGPDGAGPLCRGGYRGYGLAVVIDTGDGRQTLYAHLSQVDVAAGQQVEPQTMIGLVGETGCVSGPHLHFGLRRDGQLVDPVEVLR